MARTSISVLVNVSLEQNKSASVACLSKGCDAGSAAGCDAGASKESPLAGSGSSGGNPSSSSSVLDLAQNGIMRQPRSHNEALDSA